MAKKGEARARWEKAEMNKAEEAAYIQVSMPVRALDYTTEEEGAALGKVAHLAGIRAVEDMWEHEWEGGAACATQPTQKQQQDPHQRRQDPRQPQRAPQQAGRQVQPRAPQQTAQAAEPPQRAPQQAAKPAALQQAQRQQQTSSWAQRAAAAAALPQRDSKRIGRNGKVERDPTGLEPIKRSLP